MSEIVLLPADRFGYGFVPPQYLPENENEQYLRDIQVNAEDHSWRQLSSDEIETLVKNGNTCTNWYNVRVEDPFDPMLIKNSLFAGLVRIGATAPQYLQYHDFTVPVGITNSRIISCDIGDNCAIHDCANLAHYIIGDTVILSRIDEMASTNHAKFGEGILKDGESEDVRIWIDPLNEAGGRSILPFVDMICADAYLWTIYRDDKPLMEKLKELTQSQVDSRRGFFGMVGDGSVIKSCQVIKDVNFGPSSYVKGANKLKNLTIKSSAAEPSQIGEGVELVNGVIGYGCHVFYGVKAVRFVLGNNSNLKYGARLIHSILGDNSTISCCEVLNNLVFPGHEQHHNNSFLIATMIMGQSNMAAGATVGSNHNSRGNDGEIIAGRGFWPGLSSTLKHNCRFASYTLLTKGSYPAELNIPLPFSLVLEDRKNDHLNVMPAYYWLYNMYALERNSWKYRTRDKRKTIVQHIEADHLAPDTAKEILQALSLLELWTGKAWFIEEEGGDDLPSDEVLRSKGRELITTSPETVNELFILGEGMERSSRPVRILKTVRAWNAYRQMLQFYGVKSVASYLSTYGIHYGYFAAQAPKDISLDWVNMGGQLVPEGKVDGLRASIRTGLIDSWAGVHEQYEAWWQLYPRDKAENAYAVLKAVTGEQEITGERWNRLLDEALETRAYVEEQVYVTKKKDYTNAFREITYRNADERDAVLGKVEDNSFIQTAKKETAEFREMIQKGEGLNDMPILLKNKDLSLTVETAGEKYRGSRFDWNGLVSQVKFRGVTLLGQEKPMFQRNPAIFGRGLHNEFGIKKCIGYDDCAVGEWFPKIGTGWLRKDEKPYFFYTQYPLEKLAFDCEVSGKNEARFTCDSGERNGYAYRYVKKITLEDSVFKILYTLENTGSKALDTDEYIHNFLCIGVRRMDAGYSLSFPWNIEPSHLVEITNPDEVLSIAKNRIDIVGQTDNQFYLGGLSEGVTESDGLAASWTLADSRRKISVSERGSFLPSGIHVWGWKSVISPEVFFSFRVDSGNVVSWERAYSVSSLKI